MNGKRVLSLALAALLALLPLAAFAQEEKFVQNVGLEPLGVYAQMGDEAPAWTLDPGAQVRWLGEEVWNGVLWYQVQGGFVPSGPGVTVITVTTEPAPPVEPETPVQPEQPTEPEQPAEPETPVQPEQPVQEPEPEAPALQIEPMADELRSLALTPQAPAEPALQTEPEAPEQPAAGTDPGTPEQPAVEIEPEPPEQPAAETDPEPPEQLGAEAAPEQPTSPEQPEGSTEPEPPVQPDEPEASTPPEEATEPEQPPAQTDTEPSEQPPAQTDAEPSEQPPAEGDPSSPAADEPEASPEPAGSDSTPAPTDAPAPAGSDSTPAPTDAPAPTTTATATPTPTPTPRPGGASATELIVDTAYLYPGMAKSYADGYMPTVSGGKALFVLPLLGDVLGDVVRVTPDISTSGPFLYGNYQFDLKKSTQTAADSAGNQMSREVFLVSLSLDLAKNRYNGTYPMTFQVDYTDKNGDPAQQFFTLQVTITDGKNRSTGGGSGGPTAVKKPVLVLVSGQTSVGTITGGEVFTLTMTVQNVGDLEARNVRILAAADGQGIYRSDSLAPVFLALLDKEASEEITFPFASDKTVFAGRHGLTVTLSYEDKYGNLYGDSVPLQILVRQESSIGFDEMKLPETLTSGDTFTQPVCVYNTGYAPVYNVRCTLRMDGLIAASAFLGTLEPQQSADKAISIFVTTLPGKEKYGAAYGELVISYEDMAGQEHTEYQQLRTTVQAPVEITDEEKAKKEKEQKEQQTLSQWWVSLLVAIAFILIILSAIVIARFTRMLKMK